MPPLSIRAHGSSLPLVLIEWIAHVRAVGGLPSPSCLWHDTLACRLGQALNGAHWAPAPPKGGGETWLSANFLVAHLLGSPSGGRYVPVGRCPAADRGGSRDAGTATAVTERATCQRFYTAHGRGPLAPRPLRHAFGMTPPPKGEARLGSPFGGAGAVRRLRGQGATGRERRGKAAVSLAFFYALRA